MLSAWIERCTGWRAFFFTNSDQSPYAPEGTEKVPDTLKK